jgi:hypothetical protein
MIITAQGFIQTAATELPKWQLDPAITDQWFYLELQNGDVQIIFYGVLYELSALEFEALKAATPLATWIADNEDRD